MVSKTILLKIKLKKTVYMPEHREHAPDFLNVFSNLIKAHGQFDTLFKVPKTELYVDHLFLEKSMATEYIAFGVSFCSRRFY